MRAPEQQPIQLTVKPHFQLLDGLRGVAAIAVLIFHFMEFAVADYAQSFIAHGYLAVDFFFCLSGFVIAYAYDNKVAQLGNWAFFRLRLIRLQPLVIVGSVLGLIGFVLDPFQKLYPLVGPAKTATLLLTSCLMVPGPVITQRASNLFALNPPTWSLMWEYIANVLYALVLVRIPRRTLVALVGLAALGLCYTAHFYGNLGVGWSYANAAGGLSRVAASFLIGLLIYRSGWVIRNSLGFVAISLLLLLAFALPYTGFINKFVELVVVLVYFPLLVALGAGTRSSDSLNGLCKQLGAISYPLYMIHYPFLWLFGSYVKTIKPSLADLLVIIPAGAVSLIGLSYIILVYIDIPLRRYLTTKRSGTLVSK